MNRARVWLALGVLWTVWGSTYLGIAVAVAHWPPLLLAGVRFTAAGIALLAVSAIRGSAVGSRRAWAGAAIAGLLLVPGANGLVCMAEQHVTSGRAALIMATVPIQMVFWDWAASSRLARAFTNPAGGGSLEVRHSNDAKPSGGVVIGMVVGLIGIGVLAGADLLSGADDGWSVVLLIAAASWSGGSLMLRRTAGGLSSDPDPSAALGRAFLLGGLGATAMAVASGDLSLFDPMTVPPVAWYSFGYLLVAGSLLGAGAYTWLLIHTPLWLATSYATVCPIIAVFLGVVVLSEPIGAREVFAGVLVVSGVALGSFGSANGPTHLPSVVGVATGATTQE